MNKFWAVLKETKTYSNQITFPSKEEAIFCAERLTNSSGVKCFVLEAVGFTEPIPIAVRYEEISS